MSKKKSKVVDLWAEELEQKKLEEEQAEETKAEETPSEEEKKEGTPKKETPKKENKKITEKVFEDNDEPTNNYTLLWNRYVKAIDDLKAIVEWDKDFYNATEWKFKYVAVGGSIKFFSNWKYVNIDLKNPYITVNDKKTAEIVVRSKRFKIISYK